MPSINMISARRAEKKKLEKYIRAAFLVFACEIVIALGLLSFVTARAYSASRTMEHLDRELKKIQPTVDQIRYYEAGTKKLMPRLNLLAESREKTLFWYTVLTNLSRSVPENTWLNSFTSKEPTVERQTDEAQGGSAKPAIILSLRGTSTSQRLVGETMLRLNQCAEFEKVDLNYTQKGADTKLDTVEFEIATSLKPIGSTEGGTAENASH